MGLRVGDRSVVMQNIQASEMFDRLAHHGLDAVGIGGVEAHCQATALQCIHCALGRIEVDIGADNLRALLGEAQCRRRTDAATAPCDDGHFS